MNVTQPPTDAKPMTREEMEAIFLTLVDCDHFKHLPFPMWFRQKHRKLLGIPNTQCCISTVLHRLRRRQNDRYL